MNQNTNQINIINDVASLSKVPVKLLNELVSRETLCIGSAIKEAVDAKEPELILNIGLGNLSINTLDMQCKFIPSAELKTVIKKSIKDKINPLIEGLEQSFIDKLIKAYSEEL